MSRLTRDGTAEPVFRDQILRRERGQEKINLSVQLATSIIGNLTYSFTRFDIWGGAKTDPRGRFERRLSSSRQLTMEVTKCQ